MTTFILLYIFQIASLVIYLLIEFAEIRSIIRDTENNIINTIIKNEISNESPKDNK